MSTSNFPDGSIISNCFSGTNVSTPAVPLVSGAGGTGCLGSVSTPHPWGATKSIDDPENYLILELYETHDGPVVWVHKPSHSPALFDELTQQLTSLENPPRWELPALEDETTDTFLRFIKPLIDIFFARARELTDADPGQLEAAEDLARGVLLWRYGIPESTTQANTARAKGVWGELVVLNKLEDSSTIGLEGGLENSSSCWRMFGAKWDIDKPGILLPIEVKTTMRNTHTHELRHNQLDEGRACGLRLVSVRCSETSSLDAPTLETMLMERRTRAELLGEEGAVCAARVSMELERLTASEKSLRLQQEGTVVVIPVDQLPLFPEFPADYRDLRYTVDFSRIPTAAIHDLGISTATDAARQPNSAFRALGYAPEPLLQEAGPLGPKHHELVINWAQEHSGQNFSWSGLDEAATFLMGDGNRIIMRPKGIYKAAGTPWARSVRHQPSSGYRDTPAQNHGCWYELEVPATERPPREGPRSPAKFTVSVVWITEFDSANRRVLLSRRPLDEAPILKDLPDSEDLGAYTNKALWFNYIYQIPLVHLLGF